MPKLYSRTDQRSSNVDQLTASVAAAQLDTHQTRSPLSTFHLVPPPLCQTASLCKQGVRKHGQPGAAMRKRKKEEGPG